jgi:type IV pilus assembly protein PilY1
MFCRQFFNSILLAAFVCISGIPEAKAVSIPNYPLFIISARPNVLMILDSSNSMDEAPNGEAKGAQSPESKSEIARGTIRKLINDYSDRINMGLMSYATPPGAMVGNLYAAYYDVSYDPNNYDPEYSGPRKSSKKRFRTPNPTDPGKYIYYNVAAAMYGRDLSYYDYSANMYHRVTDLFCYSPTADFDNGSETVPFGPWDIYRCFERKIGTNDGLIDPLPQALWDLPSERGLGYSLLVNGSPIANNSRADSSFAEGVLDYGKLMVMKLVGHGVASDYGSGRGYLHVPINEINYLQKSRLIQKLRCNINNLYNSPPCSGVWDAINGVQGIQNVGPTPIEGTLLTARDYFKGTLTNTEGYTSSTYPLPKSCGKNFAVLLTDGLPSLDKNGNLVTNPATAISQAASAAKALKDEGVETYVIGFALPYGVDPTTLDKIAAEGGTSTAYSASDDASLQEVFDSIFVDIIQKLGSASSVTANTTSISLDTAVYTAQFHSKGWLGDLVAYPVTASGVGNTPLWKASEHVPTPTSRKIFTRSGGSAVEFTWANLSSSDQAALGGADVVNVVNYLRGDRSKELQNGGKFRNRAKTPDNVLGDIAHSSPFYVKDTNTVYVGANDGMLHAFNATTGQELFAYIPSAMISKLKKLSVPSYAHDYFVDGDIAVSSRGYTGDKNYLVATLGHGGKGLFGLDVTMPGSFATTDVKWECFATGGTVSGCNGDSDLGFMLGRPVIAKMNNDKWAVIVGNGYNSSSGKAVLYIFNLDDGTLLKKIDTGVAGDNGLASPGVFDSNGDGKIDFIYAGDLKGNVWKFDVSHSDTDQWEVAFKSGSTPQPFFTAKDGSGNPQPQPITAPITVDVNDATGDPNYGKRYIFFGTGSYFRSGDPSDTQVQSWYGLIDDGSRITDRTQLMQRSIVKEGVFDGKTVRVFSQATANDMAGKKGWYLDFTTRTGERIVTASKLDRRGRPMLLIASSIKPVADLCAPGGVGFVNAVDPFSGARFDVPVFDINDNGDFTDDKLDGIYIGGFDLNISMPSEPIVVGNRLVVGGTSGVTVSVRMNEDSGYGTLGNGRISWREIILN